MTASEDEISGIWQKRLKKQYVEQERQRERATIALTDDELEALLDHLDDRLGAEGCDHSHRIARRWLTANGKDERVLAGFEELGGYCDCEILANVDLDGFEG